MGCWVIDMTMVIFFFHFCLVILFLYPQNSQSHLEIAREKTETARRKFLETSIRVEVLKELVLSRFILIIFHEIE